MRNPSGNSLVTLDEMTPIPSPSARAAVTGHSGASATKSSSSALGEYRRMNGRLKAVRLP